MEPSQISPMQVAFNDILQWHNYLKNVKQPSESIKDCIARLEVHIKHHIFGLQMMSAIKE